MLGGDEEKDPDAAKKEEERQEALRQEEEERKAKYAKMEAEREAMRQGIRDKVGAGPGGLPRTLSFAWLRGAHLWIALWSPHLLPRLARMRVHLWARVFAVLTSGAVRRGAPCSYSGAGHGFTCPA